MSTLTVENGELQLVNQLKDYANRGDLLDSYSLLEFYRDTYDGRKLKNDSPDHVIERSNKRSDYKDHNNTSKCRVVRRKGHETMVELIGSWIPRRDNEETYAIYCGTMLALLVPWRDMGKLHGQSSSLEEEFNSFLTRATPKQLAFVKNSYYFHESSDSASNRGQQ
jgi:hypothetical protein